MYFRLKFVKVNVTADIVAEMRTDD